MCPPGVVWRSSALIGVICAALASGVEQGYAQEVDGQEMSEDAGTREASLAMRSEFGALLYIEAIDLSGNSSTADEVILSALGIRVGDEIRASSRRFRSARYRVLALGFFREVELSLAKGSERGRIRLKVSVVERGTLVLNRMFFGTSLSTPYWAGLDLGDRNFAGSGVNVGGAFVYAGQGKAEGASEQMAFQLRASDSVFFAPRFGWHGSAHYVDASEAYRVRGAADDASVENFAAFDYRRLGGQGGISMRLSPLSRLTLSGRLELVEAALPDTPQREFPDGDLSEVDLFLDDGASRVVTASVAYDRDTRPDPVLPWTGDRFRVHGEVGSQYLGGSYDYALAFASYQRWWPVKGRKHVLSLQLQGGAVLGDAPLFDRLHVGDFNRMVTARAMGLLLSTTPSLDLLNTSTDELSYGELAGIVETQYSYRLFRRAGFVYGGDLFVGVGLWTLGTTQDIDPRDAPVDILLDAGLRLDTEVGIFELSIANALGRLPL